MKEQKKKEEYKMKISGLIVVAGLSSRMGDFKPLMKVDNKPLIINTINSLKNSKIEDITVVVGHRGTEIENIIKNENINIIYNREYKTTDMYHSFKLGLESIKDKCEGVVFFPGDVGFVSKYTIDLLIDEINKKQNKIIYPMYKDKIGHPPVISKECFEYLLSYKGENGLKGAMQKFKNDSKELDTPDKFILYDMDYKKDFEKVKYKFENRESLLYKDCDYLLSYFEVEENIIKHCKKVKEVCVDLVEEINKDKQIINIEIIKCAAMLHDMKRDNKNHAKVASNILNDLGYKQIGYIIKNHMELEENLQNLVNETTILYFADKLVKEDKFIGLEKRFLEKLDKFEDNKEIKENIMKKYNRTLTIKSNIISIIGNEKYEKLEAKWRVYNNDLFK